MPAKTVRVALYLNQFYGQVGGEADASIGPRLLTEPVGPGRALVPQLQPGEELVGTVVCGDNYFADHSDIAARECLELLRGLQPDILLAGPAFNAGRYGVACGSLCRLAGSELGIPAVTAMHEENPGTDLYRRDVVIVRAGETALKMRETLAAMVHLARKLRAGQPLGRPESDGYFPQGHLKPELAGKNGAERAVDMLLAKLRGVPFTSEVPLPNFTPPPAPAPVPDLRDKLVAIVTDGGLVPAGNPDGIESSAATRFGAYSIAGLDRLDPAAYEVSHHGYDNRYVREDPNRLVPLDVARELVNEGRIGRLYDKFLSTCGLSNPIQNSRRLGQDMAQHLKQAGVDAVILTST